MFGVVAVVVVVYGLKGPAANLVLSPSGKNAIPPRGTRVISHGAAANGLEAFMV
jgi:hypothetical protein